ncbi:uncharacterized protein [Oscarella lobularis]|uniref:uncharacterized protein n=1 Tax=Oscarella lobularis TaxID=121494 RepID=UPI0033140C48
MENEPKLIRLSRLPSSSDPDGRRVDSDASIVVDSHSGDVQNGNASATTHLTDGDDVGETEPDGIISDLRDYVKKNYKEATKLFVRRCGVRLGELFYWISRLCLTFWVLEAAVMICAFSVNFVFQFVIGMFLPVIKDENIDESLVNAGSFFFLLAVIYPILIVIPVPFVLAKEVWSADELPKTRLMVEYIRFRIERAMEYKNKPNDRVSTVLKVSKTCLVIFIFILSVAIGQSKALELFFLIGLFFGFILFLFWLGLRLVVKILAYRRDDAVFPTTAILRAIRYHPPSGERNKISFLRSEAGVEDERRIRYKCILTITFALHVLVSVCVVAPAFTELGTPAGFIVLLVFFLVLGLMFSYYSAFSSNEPLSKYNKPQYESHLKCLGLCPPTHDSLADGCMTVVFVGIVLIVTLVLANVFVSHSYESSCDVIPPTNATSSRAARSVDAMATAKYDVCSQTWLDRLDVVDLALLAHAAYKDEAKSGENGCTNELNDFLTAYFPADWNWTVVGKPTGRELVGFYELYSAPLNVTVIAIRGTRFSHLTDLMQDADLYTEAATLQFFSLFVPTTILLPLDTVTTIVYFSSFIERMFHNSAKYYYDTLIKYIESKLEFYRGRVLITGHSLGGSIAKIAGATLGIRTFAFNSPGLLFSRRKFNLDQRAIDLTAVNVAMKNDIISEIDRLGGTVHHIDCPTDSLLTCHRIYSIVCEFQDKCQFPNRPLPADCSNL